MKILKLKLDYLIGPIIKDTISISDNKLITGIDIIDNDHVLSSLDNALCMLYSSFYEFSSEQPCIFNKDELMIHINEVYNLYKKLIDRLEQINDGPFEIENMILKQLKSIAC